MYVVNIMVFLRPFRFCLFSFVLYSFSSSHFQMNIFRFAGCLRSVLGFPVACCQQISVPLSQSQPHILCLVLFPNVCFFADTPFVSCVIFLLLSLLLLPYFLSFLIRFKAIVLKSLPRNSKAHISSASVSEDVFFFFELITFHYLLVCSWVC